MFHLKSRTKTRNLDGKFDWNQDTHDKTEEELWNRTGRKEIGNTIETKDTTRENKPEVIGERRKTKKISRQNKTTQTKQDVPKQRKIFYQQIMDKCTNTYKQPDDKEKKLCKELKQRELKRNVERINNMEKDLQGIKEALKLKIHLTHSEQHSKEPNWKTQGIDGIHRFWFKNHFHQQQIGYWNEQMPTKTDIPEWMTKGKITQTPPKKKSLKRSAPNNYRRIPCLPMDQRMRKLLTMHMLHFGFW